jgi:hypothetical protein
MNVASAMKVFGPKMIRMIEAALVYKAKVIFLRCLKRVYDGVLIMFDVSHAHYDRVTKSFWMQMPTLDGSCGLSD